MKQRKHTRLSKQSHRIFIIAALLVLSAASFTVAGRLFGQNDVRGWLWNAYQFKPPATDQMGLGWVSLSCFNDFDNDGLLEYECSDGTLDTEYGVSIGLTGALDGTNDFVRGCAWSGQYGWVCFDFDGSPTGQCTGGAACADLPVNGVPIVGKFGYCSNGPTLSCASSTDCSGDPCKAYFYHMQSPAYPSWSIGASEHATVLSLYNSADEVKGYVGFPYTDDSSVAFDPATRTFTQDTLFGCFGCRNVCSNNKLVACVSDDDCSVGSTCGVCDACLNTSVNPEDAENPNPNLLCWDCTDCGIGESGGSCNLNRDKNSCFAQSCSQCTEYPGVVVNQTPQGSYEMCGWGYHAYNDTSITVDNAFSLIDNDNFSGLYNDIAVDSAGLPVALYHRTEGNVNTGRVRLARCGDPFCITKKTIDIDEDVGHEAGEPPHMDIMVKAGDIPIMSYIGDAARQSVRFAACTDPSCDSVTTDILATISGATKFVHTSIALGSGFPLVSYHQDGQATLYVYSCSNASCSAGTSYHVTPDATGGSSHTILVPNDNIPVIAMNAYNGTSNDAVGFVRCANATCSAGNPRPITFLLDNNTNQGISNVGAAISNGTTIYIAYLNKAVSQIQVIRCTDLTNCTAATMDLATVATSVSAVQGEGPISVKIDADGYPVMSFVDNLSRLRVIRCLDEKCLRFTNQIITRPGHSTQRITGLAMSKDDMPIVSYFESNNSDLWALKCSTRTCAANPQKGLGWAAFNPSQIGDLAYVEAQQGNIFSGGNIYSPVGPPVNKYNAAYLIEAGGDITNWFSRNRLRYSRVSQSGAAQTQIPEFPGIDTRGVYSNVLGALDVEGIVTDVLTGTTVDAADPSGTNKYGATIEFVIDDTFLDATPPALGAVLKDHVYYIDGDLTISATKQIDCGAGADRGAGIIVVNGDLHINKDVGVVYTAASSPNCTSMTSLRGIQSLVWIIQGDVIFKKDSTAAQQASGVFAVLGVPASSECPTLDVASNHCGRVSTGRSDQRLTIAGGMIARQYNFERTTSALSCGASTSCPAEAFVADGRLQANPPSGLSRFADSVPRFTFGF